LLPLLAGQPAGVRRGRVRGRRGSIRAPDARRVLTSDTFQGFGCLDRLRLLERDALRVLLLTLPGALLGNRCGPRRVEPEIGTTRLGGALRSRSACADRGGSPATDRQCGRQRLVAHCAAAYLVRVHGALACAR